MSTMVNELHGTSMQVEAPQLLGPAFEALAGAESLASIADEKGTEFRIEEENTPLDLGLDNWEETVSLGPAADNEVENDLEQVPEDEAPEIKEEVELNFAVEDELDSQMELAEAVGQGKVDLEKSLEAGEQEESDTAAGDTLNLESIELSGLSPEIDSEGQEETLDFHEDPPTSLWALNASAADVDSMLDKVSEDIFEFLAPAEYSDEIGQSEKPTSDSESSNPNKNMGREENKDGEESKAALNKVSTEINNALNKLNSHSVN
jgi:hypothetical protein